MCETDKNTLENGIKRSMGKKNHGMADEGRNASRARSMTHQQYLGTSLSYGCSGEILSRKSEQ